MLNVAFFGNKTLGIITSDFHREAELLASRWLPAFYTNGFLPESILTTIQINSLQNEELQ
ncbi:hypothetical protein DVQ28_20875 [Yersinia enterocolitica]|uniref:Uncharacterized protein n=1 Tax=Yersinia enterocolitica W22703 TaxID=913028 RepID=F4MZR5_YEREN|nr:hypothetical protein [Yersinia enterocolitica]EKN6293228.1 hypothetical protein [Yersinia enterocolitica]CBX71323.1 unknown protein [Yersinia enterocolitica W22703]